MPRPPLPFTAPHLLAPMEGVTEPSFRDLVLLRNEPAALGGAFTEFVRVIDRPLPRRVLARHLGARRFPQPVGLQLMGAELDALAETARRAVEVGAPLVDLNFGCPAKGALRGCAGSAVLRDPGQLERTVRAVAKAVPDRPVSAKIRAGYDDAERVEDLARAAEAGGAALLTVHCRTRAEAYCDEVDWTRLSRAAAAVTIPVCGNGGVRTHADLARLRRETGCRLAMVGRAACGDPWIFTGTRVTAAEAARFLLDYAQTLRSLGASAKGAAGRVKQLLVHWTAGGLTGLDGAQRASWLRETDAERLLARLAEAEGGAPRSARNPELPETHGEVLAVGRGRCPAAGPVPAG
ncbi:MAG: tRNA-dihydrouridine synthase family protein [Planctomycetes bacterium]|nr:tRNA-dihydrouridine synthase family protein [Planctomycetota bacterium]